MGRLIWLMGPSGSGKDSLLAALRRQAPGQVLVAHRYITRPASAGGENHIALSEQEFRLRRDKGLFALHWQAHQHDYGVGRELDLWLAAGCDVVLNGSRQHLAVARARYGAQLLAVCLVVSPAILRQRLLLRGRESPAQIEQRLARGEDYGQGDDACLTLNNDGPPEVALAAFLAMLAPDAEERQ